MTINEIKKEMTDAFIADAAIQAAYGLGPGLTFDEQFSKVSIERLFFYIVATEMAALQFLFNQFKIEVEERIKAAIPGTIAWYHNLVMNWEYPEKSGIRLIKFCSVTEEFPWLRIKINTENHGVLAVESDEMIALRSYLSHNKFAGTQINVTSEPPEIIEINMRVWLSAAQYTSNGEIIGTDEKPVETAIANYLSNIVYSGTFFRSRLVDAVQAVAGVNDVELLSAKIGDFELPASYKSKTGAFTAKNDIIYVLN